MNGTLKPWEIDWLRRLERSRQEAPRPRLDLPIPPFKGEEEDDEDGGESAPSRVIIIQL